MPQPPIGIDLGTTYSAVASLDDKGTVYLLPNSEGLSLTPSVVFFENAGNIVVGQVAKDARADNPTDVIEFVKRSMGTDRKYRFREQDFTPIDISAIILSKLKQDAEAGLGGNPITQAVVTCPAYFGAEARDATEKAARIAGLELLALINEPTAAAMAFGMGGERKGTALVFDLGGGTFDVTLLRFAADNSIDVLAVDGNHELGGKDFDDAIMSLAIKHFMSEHNYDIYSDPEALGELRQKVEKAKHDLTARESTSINIFAGGHKTKFELTRKQFADAIAHHIENMRMTVMSVLDEKELRPQDVDEILMVGGSSRVPAVFDMVASFFGKQPNTSVHPDEVVAYGAALFASQMMVANGANSIAPQVKEIVKRLPSVKDIVPHSIGTTAIWDDDQEHNSIILRRGSKLGTLVKETFRTRENGQRIVRIDINEGEGNDLEYVQRIGGFELVLAEPRPAGSPIDVEMSLDRSGVIRVVAKDKIDDTAASIAIEYTSNISSRDVAIRKNWLAMQVITAQPKATTLTLSLSNRPQNRNEDTIFISYKRLDWSEFVVPLIDKLRLEELPFWVDQHLLEGGDDWLDEINQALRTCRRMILCISPAALESRHVKLEYRYFFNQGKKIYPLMCRDADLPAELQTLQYYPFHRLDELIKILLK